VTETDDQDQTLGHSIRRLVVKRSDIEAMIQRYVEAEMAVLDGKSITFNGQQMSYENLSEIRRGGRSGSGGLPTVTAKPGATRL
jgi:hypothetical protein